MITVGFDLDGVVSLLPFNWKQAMLTRNNEKVFWFLQRSWLLQRIYNFLIRKPNPEIKALMEELKEKGIRMVIVSASNEDYRKELEIWLIENRFCYFEALILKERFEEDCQDYKARTVPIFCDYYLDDKKEIVQRINDSNNGRCRAILYRGQTKEELLREFLLLLKILKTV